MAEDNAEVKSQSSGKGLMIVLIALIFILIIAVAGGFYFLYNQTSNLSNNQNQGQVEQQAAAPSAEAGNFKADINELVLNLTDSRGREKLMKLSFSIKSTDPTIAAVVENYKAEIIDVVISQIGARSSEELLTVGGKNLLKDELVNDINGVLNSIPADKKVARDSVKTILFTTFVIK
ncbi:flagellar basal body-associated FliL family protein [Arcobacter vandammei]|uniref:flagellar basal body-associated FliL family protein n=1 Tax=Arcobacter vandammei TaxID=2782243 RepID=UPI0018DFECAA|nr:flagellar basal body-associated FliL family protein [Arcobacter vandammei]